MLHFPLRSTSSALARNPHGGSTFRFFSFLSASAAAEKKPGKEQKCHQLSTLKSFSGKYGKRASGGAS